MHLKSLSNAMSKPHPRFRHLRSITIAYALLSGSDSVAASEFYPNQTQHQLKVTAEDYQPTYRSLANLRGLYVNVAPINGFFNRLRIGKADTLIAELKKRVESAGLNWLSKDSVEQEPGQPTLNFFPSYKPGCCTLALWSGFSQGARVLSSPEHNFRLSSWGSGANHYGGEEGATCLDPAEWARNNIIDKMEGFLADYQRAKEFVTEEVGATPKASSACSTKPTLIVEMFDTNSYTLGVGQRKVLDELAANIAQCPDLNYRIEANSDQRGSSEYNLQLSQQRARSIKTYLVASGFSSDRFDSRALGEGNLATTGTSAFDLAANRRVVITPQRTTPIESAPPPPSVYKLLPGDRNKASTQKPNIIKEQ